MSRENVELVRQALDAFQTRDLETVFNLSGPEITLEVSDAYFDQPRTYRGHDGMRQLFAAQAEVSDPFRLAPEKFLDAGDQVVVMARAGGVARASGAELLGRFGHVWTLAGGKIVAFEEFKNPADALEAVGLRE